MDDEYFSAESVIGKGIYLLDLNISLSYGIDKETDSFRVLYLLDYENKSYQIVNRYDDLETINNKQ